MTKQGTIRTLLISLSLLLALAVAGYVVLIELLDLDTYKEQILAELEQSLKRPVSYKTGALTFSLGPAISFHGVSVKEPDSSGEFVSIKNLTCRLDLLPLLKKQIVVHGLVADSAEISLVRKSDGRFNISDLMDKSGPEETRLKIHQLKLKDANITFIDRFIQQTPIVTKLERTDLFLENLNRGAKGSFKLATRLGGGASGALHLNGKIRLSPADTPLDNSSIDAKLSCKQLDSAHYWPYYSRYVPFRKILGTVDADTEIHGKLNEFTSSGKITIRSPKFDYQPIFRQALTAKNVQMKYSLELNQQDITLKGVEVDIDGAEIKGSFALREYRSKDPRITAQAVTSKLDFAKYKQFIPYGIIVKDTGDWIEQHLTGGIYQLDEGRLDGKISQILHMETGENYNILYIKAKAEKGVVSYGSKVPTFNNIRGTLELKGKDFLLHGMSGSFGTSPMTLEGRITDYPLDRPSGYPFRMVISPSKGEIAWLLGKDKAAQLLYNGNSSLTLNGDGYTSGYNLSGEWNLAPASYSYASYITKQVGTPSHIKFKGSLNPKEANLTSLHFTLGGAVLDLSAKYPFEPAKSLDLLINSNLFSLDNIAQTSPFMSHYNPSGRVQVSLRGTLPPATETFKWRGTVALSNASIRYSQAEKPLSAINGTISFDEESMESSQLNARVGNSSFSGKGTISSLKPLSFNTAFTAPRIDLADFGLKFPQKAPLITKVKAELAFKENSLNIRNITGNLNNSQLSIRGSVSDIEKLKAELAVSATYLDISDLILFEGIEKIAIKGARPAPAPAPVIKATVKADKAVFNGAEFERLNGAIVLASKALNIQPFEADFLGGRLAGKGKIDAQGVPTRYQGEFRLANASADQLTDFISGNKKEVTGVMTLEGNLNASGDNYDALKKSAAGRIKVHATKGMLRQFSGLSKVFSILNVSQLFSFKLPDMVAEGMPYTEINGTFEIKAGFVNTTDLFIASNAMNLSIVGKHDFVNDNLDLTIGVQPLQTVDKVVSHIPIVGWILTGKEKSLISTYFEVKGKSSAPKVSAIPVTSLGRGVLGIFKRVFQLPAKLITDTGEVILNN